MISMTTNHDECVVPSQWVLGKYGYSDRDLHKERRREAVREESLNQALTRFGDELERIIMGRTKKR